MWKNLSYKKKFYLMLVGALLLIWVSFKFGFARTIELKSQLGKRVEQLSGIKDAPSRLHAINSRLEEIEKLIGDVSGDDASPYLIEKAGRYCKENDLILNEIPRKHRYEKDEFAIITYKIIIQGPFKKLLRLLNEMEENSEAGKLRAAVFESEYILKKDKRVLYGIYYIQSVGSAKK